MRRYFVILVMLITPYAHSAAPVCAEHVGGNYCSYYGFVSQIYVRKDIILLYFDTPIDTSIPAGFGMNAEYGDAGMIKINENPEFSRLFYSTALAAQASKRKVNIQMRGVEFGYLKIDRIWLSD